MGSYKATISCLRLIFRLAVICYFTTVAFLQRQIPHKIDPFFRLHRGPNEEEIIDDCRDRETLWDQQQPCTLMGRDKRREVSGHGLQVVGHEDTAFFRSAL